MVGDGLPVVVMGVVNVSPESFHAGSVYQGEEAIVRAALGMVEAGAALIDVGARSTAPYLPTTIDEDDEIERLGRAVSRLTTKLNVPISADTASVRSARAALEAGARVINDVSGVADPALARLVADWEVGLIAMASPAPGDSAKVGPMATVATCLRRALARARAAGVQDEHIMLDPGIGFFRHGPVSWVDWDVTVLARLESLLDLGRPLCVAVSRKSFIGAITGGASPGDHLAGSLAAAAVAVVHGASLIRTHDARETLDAVRVAARIREAGREGRGE
jgi:dihydropteroate synthase